jgi:hypothetical protein
MIKQLFALQLGLLVSVAPCAHDEDLKAGQLKPRTALMSKEVAREKLKAYGITNVKSLKQVGQTFTAEGVVEGRPIVLEIDRQAGIMKERGQTRIFLPKETPQTPVLKDFQIKPQRDELIAPQRMKGVLEALPEETQ